MANTLRVKGLRELNRALLRSDRELQKSVRKEIREVARIVADDARARFMPTDPRTSMGMRPQVRGGFRAVAEQRRRRTTGKHPEFGVLQMRRAFLPALAAKEDEVLERFERILDRLEDGWDK